MAGMVQAWREMSAAGEAASQVLTAMGNARLPGTGVSADELRMAVLSELWRVGGSIENARGWRQKGDPEPPPIFPGARPVDPNSQYNPSKEPGLVNTLRQSTDYLSRTVINPPKEDA